MNSLMKNVRRVGVRLAVWLYRLSDGRFGGSFGGTPVLLLTVAGRKTGIDHTVPVSFFDDNDRYIVLGSAGGGPTDPQWFRNLRHAAEAHIQIRSQVTRVSVRIADDVEREALLRRVILARAPGFAAYQKKTSRPIPIAVLTPD